jgi:hypothetical protein
MAPMPPPNGHGAYGAAEFLSSQDYKNIERWVETISAREPVQRGRRVYCSEGRRVPGRHEAGDIDMVRKVQRADGDWTDGNGLSTMRSSS